MKEMLKVAGVAVTGVMLAVNIASAEAKMEKCTIVDGAGKGLIKEGKNDCKTSTHACASHGPAGDASSWIYMPEGVCDKIEGGKVAG